MKVKIHSNCFGAEEIGDQRETEHTRAYRCLLQEKKI
jgi:hypothetical protein